MLPFGVPEVMNQLKSLNSSSSAQGFHGSFREKPVYSSKLSASTGRIEEPTFSNASSRKVWHDRSFNPLIVVATLGLKIIFRLRVQGRDCELSSSLSFNRFRKAIGL